MAISSLANSSLKKYNHWLMLLFTGRYSSLKGQPFQTLAQTEDLQYFTYIVIFFLPICCNEISMFAQKQILRRVRWDFNIFHLRSLTMGQKSLILINFALELEKRASSFVIYLHVHKQLAQKNALQVNNSQQLAFQQYQFCSWCFGSSANTPTFELSATNNLQSHLH